MRTVIPKSVLVVEDDHALNDLYTRLLTTCGYLVHSTKTLNEAYECLQTSAPDVVVLDLHLADGSGTEVIHWLNALGHTDTKVIVISGETYDAQHNIPLDWVHYALLKPVMPRQLVNLLHALN